MEEIMLSIYVPTYNHEKYIAQALDSILMQKTKYTYEILVGEDASTDGTREILKEYERKYPGKFKMYYRKKNMHKQKIRNAMDLIRRCRGKYIIALEGDDFWIDENKIEEQIDFLESHQEYIAVAHNCVVVDQESIPNGEEYPECKENDYTIKHYISGILPGQLTTVMRRNYYRYNIMDTSILDRGLMPGDRVLYLALILNGKVHCIQKKMSAYRHVVNSGFSYSATVTNEFKDIEKLNREMIEYANLVKSKQGVKQLEFLYLKNVVTGVKTKECSKNEAIHYLIHIHYKTSSVWLYIKYWFKINVLKRKIYE